MHIIPLTKKYLEETIRMTNEVFPDDVHAEHNPERSFRTSMKFEDDAEALAQSKLQKLGYWIVLNDADEVIGVTGLYQWKEERDDTIWLGWYCVRADQRGRGLGRELLEWTIDKVRSDGYKRFKLYTSSDPNEARAQELYEKLGFKIVGEEPREGGYKILYREKIL